MDRIYTLKKNQPSTVGTSHLTFYSMVYGEILDHVRDPIISLIDREREGEQIDQTMVREALDIYVVIGEGSEKYYRKDFEGAVTSATTAFYSRKASAWITNNSYEDYALKIEECLNQEETIVSNYLKFGSRYEVLELDVDVQRNKEDPSQSLSDQ